MHALYLEFSSVQMERYVVSAFTQNQSRTKETWDLCCKHCGERLSRYSAKRRGKGDGRWKMEDER